MLHQGILSLFVADPWLPFDVLGIERPVRALPLDRRAEVEHHGQDLATLATALPDLVLSARETVPGADPPGAVLCIEAQARVDPIKRFRVPFYQAALANRHQLPTWVFIVSFSRGLSRAIQRWSAGHPPRLDAHVLDASTVPVPADATTARARPCAAVLAATLHGFLGDIDAARRGFEGIASLPRDTRIHYTRIILAALADDQRVTLLEELDLEREEQLWEIEQRSGTFLLGVERGRQEGRQEGRQQGQIEVLADWLVAELSARALSIDDATRERIRACTEDETLRRWLERARTATDLDAVFAEP